MSDDWSAGLRDFEEKARSMLAAYRAVPTEVALTFAARISPKQVINLQWYQVNDPVIGRLGTDGVLWWTTRRDVRGFGDSVQIHLHIPNRMERRKDESIPPK